MSGYSVSTFDRYALIASLAKAVGGGEPRLGKKALQKYVHLIQELGGVDAGYRFSLYTYGPYSSSLAGDLDVVATMGAVRVTYNALDNYYSIEPAAKTDHMIGKGRAFLETNKASIDRVLKAFGGRLAKSLELVSTIAYLRRHALPGEFDDDGKLAARVMTLKPKYSDKQIAGAIGEVRAFLTAQPVA